MNRASLSSTRLIRPVFHQSTTIFIRCMYLSGSKAGFKSSFTSAAQPNIIEQNAIYQCAENVFFTINELNLAAFFLLLYEFVVHCSVLTFVRTILHCLSLIFWTFSIIRISIFKCDFYRLNFCYFQTDLYIYFENFYINNTRFICKIFIF